MAAANEGRAKISAKRGRYSDDYRQFGYGWLLRSNYPTSGAGEAVRLVALLA
jgi:hypothetical protein